MSEKLRQRVEQQALRIIVSLLVVLLGAVFALGAAAEKAKTTPELARQATAVNLHQDTVLGQHASEIARLQQERAIDSSAIAELRKSRDEDHQLGVSTLLLMRCHVRGVLTSTCEQIVSGKPAGGS